MSTVPVTPGLNQLQRKVVDFVAQKGKVFDTSEDDPVLSVATGIKHGLESTRTIIDELTKRKPKVLRYTWETVKGREYKMLILDPDYRMPDRESPKPESKRSQSEVREPAGPITTRLVALPRGSGNETPDDEIREKQAVDYKITQLQAGIEILHRRIRDLQVNGASALRHHMLVVTADQLTEQLELSARMAAS